MNLKKLKIAITNFVILINPIAQFPQYKEDFYNDIYFINIKRLSYWSYFVILFSVIQLYSDITIKDIYNQKQLDLFLKADVILAIVAVITFILSNFFQPRNAQNIKKFYKVFIYSYIFLHLNWTAVISAVESPTANGMPTFLIGVFSAATIFFTGSLVFLLFLLFCLVTLYITFGILQIDFVILLKEYSTVVTLVIIAWIVSRIILVTRMHTFISSKKLSEANEVLDQKVTERTEDLSKSNNLLIKEIKERKKYEHQLEAAVKKAEEADRLKTVFLANMSHEIRTPLNGILGFSVLLSHENLSAERKLRYNEVVINSGQQLLKIIDDIMDISLIESNQLKLNEMSFSLNYKIKEIYDYFLAHKKSIEKDNIYLFYEIGLKSPDDLIISDPIRLIQVINNLLKNAFKFTFEGKIEFGYKLLINDLLFYVSDTGIGIDAEKREIIFKSFRQGEESLKRSFGGTGLGLSICRGIIEQIGGKIWIDDTFTHGSRFYFSVPYKKALNPQ